jgi:hypothetical protein
MRKFIIAIIICTTAFVFFPLSFVAAEDIIICDPEPTDQIIQYGDFLECAISPVGDSDIYRFVGSMNEVIIVQATDQSGNSLQTACITLFGPDGMPTPNGGRICNNLTARIDETLVEDGVYVIFVEEDSGRGPIPYGLALERVDPPSPGSTPICFSCIENESIDGIGDIDLYIFNGSIGDQIKVSATDQSGNSLQTACITLFGPDGMPTPNGGRICNNLTARIDENLELDGVHAFLIEEGSGRGAIPYSTDLQCISGPCTEIPFSMDIKVNGRDGAINVTPDDTVSVTVELEVGPYGGLDVDLWIGAATPSGAYWYNSSGNWIKSFTPIWITQKLPDIPKTTILNATLPWVGVYEFFIVADITPDGIFGIVARDQVAVFVGSSN